MAALLSCFFADRRATPPFPNRPVRCKTTFTPPSGIVQGQDRLGQHGTRASRSSKDVGKINFFIHYEVDGDTSKHSLKLGAYGKDHECGCSSHRLHDTVCSIQLTRANL